MITDSLLINRSSDVVFCGHVLKDGEFKNLRMIQIYFCQLLALDNSEAGIIDQEPKIPLSFGYEAGQKP